MKMGFLLLLSFFAIFSLPWLKPEPQNINPIYKAPPKDLIHYSFDYNDMLSATLWVRLLQDMEVCDQRSERELPPELKVGDDRVEQILERKLPPSQCHLSWVYKMVDVITDLSPDFYMAYDVGGTFLSVLVDDREGAQRIYQKGLTYFPDHWELLYKASYHSLFEMQKPKEAADLLLRAGKRGAPKWVYSLSAKLYTKVGQAHFAKTVLESVLARNPQGYGVDRIEKRLVEINQLLENRATGEND